MISAALPLTHPGVAPSAGTAAEVRTQVPHAGVELTEDELDAVVGGLARVQADAGSPAPAHPH